jgi:hypothetical protein
MTREEAEGTTETAACRFWIVSCTVTRSPFHADVALAISSPTFFGDYVEAKRSDDLGSIYVTHQTKGTNFGG